MVPSEPLVLGLGLAMLLVSIGCLLEHMAATMPLLLRAAWAVRGVDFNISSVFPLAISVQVSDELKAQMAHQRALEAEARACSVANPPVP